MMKKLFLTLCAVALLGTPIAAEEGPATYFLSASGTTETGEEFNLTDLTGTFRIGVKTNLDGDASYRLLLTYRQVNIGPLADDIKSLGIGAEKYYPLRIRDGFFANSGLSIRATAQFELNQESNDVNGVIGFGWIKKLAVDDSGNAVFSVEPYFDFTAKDDKDFFTVGLSLNVTPPLF